MNIGGTQRAIYQLVREQRRRGIEADILVASEAGFYGEKARDAGAEVYELAQRHTLDYSVAARTKEILQEYTVAHFHGIEIGLIHLVSRQKNLRRFYTHRAGLFHYPLKQALRYRIAGLHLRRHFHGISGNSVQGVVAASKLLGIPRDEIPTTYNGIDFSLLEPQRSNEELLRELGEHRNGHMNGIVRIGTSANLRPLKRVHLLLEAIARLPESGIHAYVIGDGPARADLERRGCELGISHRLTFTGTKESIGDYLQLLDIFVLPTGPEESFGNSAVEAMGMGIPTIVFEDGGGLTEHITDRRDGFIVNDVQHLTETLATLIGSRELRCSVGAAGRTTVRAKYSADTMVDRFNSFYGGTISAK
jgi:glycosyltransferase involved in cell wall biosynthesis